MDGPMREVAFSQTHRRTHRRRNIVVSQFDEEGLAWRYIMQTGEGPWTTFRRIPIAIEASDDEVVQTVTRYLAGPGWDRDPATAPVV